MEGRILIHAAREYDNISPNIYIENSMKKKKRFHFEWSFETKNKNAKGVNIARIAP